jgi:hypothetical protein
MSHVDQRALVQEAANSRRRACELTAENHKLSESLALRRPVLQGLHSLLLTAIPLLSSVDSDSTDVEPSSLRLLTKFGRLPAMAADAPPAAAAIVGKYLNELLDVIVDFIRKNRLDLNAVVLFELENRLHQMFARAERQQLIPATDQQHGWKKAVLRHEVCLQRLQDMLDAAAEQAE